MERSPKMADQSKDSKKSKADAKKKDTGTVLLTPEELRTIAGGASVVATKPISINPNTTPKSNLKH